MIMDNKLKDGKYVKEIIEKELDSMGLSKMLTGYEYISQAVVMTVFDIELLKGITKRLYPCIAHEFCTSGAAVAELLYLMFVNMVIEKDCKSL